MVISQSCCSFLNAINNAINKNRTAKLSKIPKQPQTGISGYETIAESVFSGTTYFKLVVRESGKVTGPHSAVILYIFVAPKGNEDSNEADKV